MFRKLCVAIAYGAVIVACGRSPASDPLVGKWKLSQAGSPGVSNSFQIEFLSDGTVLRHNAGSQDFTGKWIRLEDGRVKMEVTHLGTTTASLLKVSFSGDAATFTFEDGKEIPMRRDRTSSTEKDKPVAGSSGADVTGTWKITEATGWDIHAGSTVTFTPKGSFFFSAGATGKYEIDGDQIMLISESFGGVTLRREGGALVGGGLKLERQ